MDKEKQTTSIIGLMHRLMLSAKAHDPHPWLRLALTREQLRVIFLLSFKGRLSPGEVAESFDVPKANVTNVIDRLVSKGLVSREQNPKDRRSCILSPTDEGRSQVEKLWEIATAKLKRGLDRMPEKTLVSLRIGLEALVAALQEEGED